MGSCWVVAFIRVRPWCLWVHPELLGSLGFALGVFELIWGRWVHSGSHCGSFGSSGVVVFTRVRLVCRWVQPESLGSLGFTLGVVGYNGGR